MNKEDWIILRLVRLADPDMWLNNPDDYVKSIVHLVNTYGARRISDAYTQLDDEQSAKGT